MKRRSAELVRMWKCLITGSVRANIGARQPGEPGAGRSALTRRPAGACGSRDPSLIDDVGRIGRVVAEPVAQPLDVGAHPLGVAGVPSGPDLAQQDLVAWIIPKDV